MANKNLIKKLNAMPGQHICLNTPDGFVDATNTATIWGEGPNVRGFAWANGKNAQSALNREQAAEWFEDGGQTYDAAAAWALYQAELVD